jgi:hypothetical protein
VVVGDARFCKDCGAQLASGLRFKQNLGWNPWFAMALSLIPGLGQFYKGKRLGALLWFLCVVIAYSAGLIGVLLHLVCIVNAGLAGAIDFPKGGLSASGQRISELANRQ